MKTIIYVLFISITLLFAKAKHSNGIIGTWKADLLVTNSDTIYYNQSEKYTVNYLVSLLNDIDDSEEKNRVGQDEGKKLYERFKAFRLYIDKNEIKTDFGGVQSDKKIKYELKNDKIILIGEVSQKYNYNIEYNKEMDILTIQQVDSSANTVTKFSRVKN